MFSISDKYPQVPSAPSHLEPITHEPPPANYGIQAHSCPPGLEYLARIDQVVIKQVVELIEGEFPFS